MDYYLKEYGILKETIVSEKYKSGEIESFKVEGLSEIYINNLKYVPRYTTNDQRKKEFPSIKLYKSGKIKTIDLEDSVELTLKVGVFKVEKIVFYETGELKRVFPLNGHISAYWSEDDEYNLAEKYDFNFKFTNFKSKIISIQLFKDGNIKSITLWPQDRINIIHKNQLITTRTGFSLYEDGSLKTCEPSIPVSIVTPIGKIEAYDKNSVGIHGEDNSLKFYNEGNVKALTTSTNLIKIIDMKGKIIEYSPKEVYLFSNSDIKNIITVTLEFKDNKVIINKKYEYSIKENKFIIEHFGEKKLTLKGDL